MLRHLADVHSRCIPIYLRPPNPPSSPFCRVPGLDLDNSSAPWLNWHAASSEFEPLPCQGTSRSSGRSCNGLLEFHLFSRPLTPAVEHHGACFGLCTPRSQPEFGNQPFPLLASPKYPALSQETERCSCCSPSTLRHLTGGMADRAEERPAHAACQAHQWKPQDKSGIASPMRRLPAVASTPTLPSPRGKLLRLF
jgi:hypothetical protein